jgi:transcriptional regulatory protein LevR
MNMIHHKIRYKDNAKMQYYIIRYGHDSKAILSIPHCLTGHGMAKKEKGCF